MKNGSIYLLRCVITEQQYVGRTVRKIERRFKDHVRYALKHPEATFKLACALRKYGAENFVVSELERCSFETLPERESFWIARLNTFCAGLNSTPGGERGYMSEAARVKLSERMRGLRGVDHPAYGYQHDEDTKSMIADSLRGRTLSDETRQKMAEAHRGEQNSQFGRPHTEEHRSKIKRGVEEAYEHGVKQRPSFEHAQHMGRMNKGRKLTEEHKAKIAAGLRRRKNEQNV